MPKRKKATRRAIAVATPNPEPPANRLALIVCAALLIAACFAAYWPALDGEFLWDDAAHITQPELRTAGGLYRIWFELGASQQYYPLLHTAFWLEHRLWGDSVLGYHVINVLLHAAAACLVWANLRQLKVPGAFLAAAIFALHPVHVESVAWISEQKNTLSAVFYLGAMWCYLRFDANRAEHWYWLAAGLFVLGLLTKTVTATLPAALLVIFWWQRGTLSWRRDILPLVPFFALGAAAGLLTAWVERTLVGAEGADFIRPPIERGLLAGRVFWFYLYKLFVPINLTFIYPRWEVSAAQWWQWVFPLAMLAWFVVLWLLRTRVRGPLAGMLFFVGTLFPVLGFLNVYPFLFSFVADHFQYLASLGVIVLVAAGTWLAPFGPQPAARWVRYGFCLVLLATLGTLTWKQSHMYSDPIALYQTTIDRNPNAWMAYNNLGTVLDKDPKKTAEALEHFEVALRMRPNDEFPNCNVGSCLRRLGRVAESVPYLERAIQIEPRYMEAHYELGLALSAMKQWEPAAERFIAALALQPKDPSVIHNNLGVALANLGRLDDAIAQFRDAARLNPKYSEAYLSLGKALLARGEAQNAIGPLEQAVTLKPDSLEALRELTTAYATAGRSAEAIATAEKELSVAQSQGNSILVREIQQWIIWYRGTLASP
jgi:tetratricopeptide (TPR) repeat protein